jgi:hypothetical protein
VRVCVGLGVCRGSMCVCIYVCAYVCVKKNRKRKKNNNVRGGVESPGWCVFAPRLFLLLYHYLSINKAGLRIFKNPGSLIAMLLHHNG